MSMRRLTRLIQGRVGGDPWSKRLGVHEERRGSAESMTRGDCVRLLVGKALEAGARPSSHPLVSLTPEMCMVIARHLK